MNGDEKASWSNETGTHTLCVRQAVTKLPEVERDVVTAQIHDAEGDVVEVRLEGNHLMAEWDDGAGETTIDPAYERGTPYDLKILAVDSRVLIYYDGALMADIPKSGAGWYFTSGSYDVQSNPDKGEEDDAAAEVIIYLLQVEHTP